jgi:hypothetical protein
MNSKATLWKFAGIAIVAASGAAAAVACDSGSNNNTPVTGVDSGTGDDGSGGSSSGGSSSGGSSSGTSSSSSGGSSSGTTDSGGSSSSSGGTTDGGEAGAPCVPDASVKNCDTCATINGTLTGAYNTCSPATVNCIPYNNAEAGVPNPLPTM